MKCLVSGATGFIGSELCHHLNSRGVPFVALSRHGVNLSNGQSTIAVDLATQEVEPQLLEGVDVVFHLAGIAHQNANAEIYQRVNHRSTVALGLAAAQAGVKRFIFLSSVKAMGMPAGEEQRTEGNCVNPIDSYGLSKRQAELDLLAASADSDMSVIILRPTLVYGRGARGNLDLLARAVRTGIPRPPAIGARSMLALEDLVELLYRLAVDAPPGCHTWIVCDGQSYSARKIYDLMRLALGEKPGKSWLPAWVWKLACRLRDTRAKPGDDPTYRKVFGTELYSSEALHQALDWRPRLKLADTVADMMVSSPACGKNIR